MGPPCASLLQLARQHRLNLLFQLEGVAARLLPASVAVHGLEPRLFHDPA